MGQKRKKKVDTTKKKAAGFFLRPRAGLRLSDSHPSVLLGKVRVRLTLVFFWHLHVHASNRY